MYVYDRPSMAYSMDKMRCEIWWNESGDVK